MKRSLATQRTRLPRPLERFENEMENLVEKFFGDGPGLWTRSGEFVPQINLAENDGQFEVTVELPGLKPEDFQVELKDNSLWISGEKREETEEKGKTFHRVERHHGEFRRVIPLPTAVDEDKITAGYTEGVLTVRVPKAEEVKPKRIQVDA